MARPEMLKKQTLRTILLATSVMLAGGSAAAQGGFYGGVSVRDGGADAMGLVLGKLPFAWNHFAAPTAEDATQRALVFGGYRWSSDISVEAAFNANDKYALRPGSIGVSSVGLGLSDPTRTWNADVYTSWEFVHSLSLYGRLGYAQTDGRALLAPVTLLAADARRLRDGVNYGVGLRYDLTQVLGLRVEYSRFNRFGGENVNAGLLPETDQVTLGVQFKF
jgi:opacity protein-like surface antigen